MKILHTSDWHLGRTLYGQTRYKEFELWLAWLADLIRQEQVDALLIAGDVFDTTAPGTRSQFLYYNFLKEAGAVCQHIVVTGGNHDSPSFLDAPKDLLKALNVHVTGAMPALPEDAVLVLKNIKGQAQAVVCAVPYLRDKDIRLAEAGESVDDKERKLLEGICNQYAAVFAIAQGIQESTGQDIPLIGMGHMFTAGGQTLEGDGVRDLYVGSLAHVPAAIFPPYLDYLALGHLHSPQVVGNNPSRRYCGSPLPMGFGEANQQKSICLVEFTGRSAAVRLVPVPVFQPLEQITGDWGTIANRITSLGQEGSCAWVEVIYTGEDIIGNLRERLEEASNGTNLSILRIKNDRITQQALGKKYPEESLDTLDTTEVFERCLTAHSVPEDQIPPLRQAYQETLAALCEEDIAQMGGTP